MKKLMMMLSLAAFLGGTTAIATNQDDKCKDKNGKVVPCKHSTKEDDTKIEKGVDKTGHGIKEGGKKVGKGAKHAGYDATHNKATKKTKINKGNEKYQDKNDIK